MDNLDRQFRGAVRLQQANQLRTYAGPEPPIRKTIPLRRKKRSTLPHPILGLATDAAYAPQDLRLAYMSGGLAMEFSRELGPRAFSQTSSRSSWDSRHKSPLSTASSVDNDFDSGSSQTSRDSTILAKRPFLPARATMPPQPFKMDRRASAGAAVSGSSAWTRYGAGGQGRQQSQQPYHATEKRMSIMGPPSSNGPRLARKYTPLIPGEGFKKLPEDILLLMLRELKNSHFQVGSLSCATCWMRDLVNIGLSSKKWWSVAKIMLYEDIQLNGCDSVTHTKKKFKLKHGTRLKLLRRTLRARPDFADYVKSLKVPSLPDTAAGKEEIDEYMNLVSSMIMACPNLERLPGFYPAYDHSFSRFMHAMSSRPKLKEAVWIINPAPFQRQRRYNLAEDSQLVTSILAPAYLLPEQCTDFLNYHSNWSNLKTLFLHCNTGGTIDCLLFGAICKQLPNLENLHVSSFPIPSFNDAALSHLPPLKSLRLDNLPGITAAGLSAFASLPGASTIEHLSLISIPIKSLPTLSRLLSRLRNLTHLTVSQAPSPALPAEEDIVLHPYLGSASLAYLHWEITNPYDDKATEILAKSIQYSGFPALRTLRAPTDFDGHLQKLCKPRSKIELPGDRYRNLGPPGKFAMPTSHSMPIIPTRASLGHSHSSSNSSNFIKTSSRSSFSMNKDSALVLDGYQDHREKGMSLLSARRMAQQRIESALSVPKFQIIIWGEDGDIVERQTVGGYLGLVESKILYTLKPDIEGMDEAVVTVDGIGGLLDGGEETHVRDGCTGSWNLTMSDQGKSGKQSAGKDRWWHTERGRWKEVPLEKFF